MRLPIDTSGMTFLCAVAPTPVLDFESRQQKADSGTGEFLFAMQLVAMGPEGADMLKVQVAGEPKGVTQGQPVRVSGLTANYWQMGERSGVSFRAAQVALAELATAGSSSRNGSEGR